MAPVWVAMRGASRLAGSFVLVCQPAWLLALLKGEQKTTIQGAGHVSTCQPKRIKTIKKFKTASIGARSRI